MWVKKTAEEIAKTRRPTRRGQLIVALCTGVLFTLILIFQSDETGSKYLPAAPPHLTSKDEIPSRILGSLVVGAIATIFICFYKSKKVPQVVCPECGVTKDQDASPKCECGGHFESLDEMKWVEKAK